MTRLRRTALVWACVLVLASAGCLGFLTGSEPLRFSATDTGVGADALEESAYSLADNRTMERTFTLELGSEERQIVVTSYRRTYNRSFSPTALTGSTAGDDAVGTATPGTATAGTATPGAATAGTVTPPVGESPLNLTAQVTVLATPDATVEGRSVNPLASLSVEQLVRRFAGVGLDGELRLHDNRTVHTLGEDRVVTTYRSNLGENATAIDVDVMNAQHEGDVVVVVATYPAGLDEADRVDALLQALERRDG